jgi:hypothetical protein
VAIQPMVRMNSDLRLHGIIRMPRPSGRRPPCPPVARWSGAR